MAAIKPHGDLSRRDVLKVLSLIPVVSMLQPLGKILGEAADVGTPNVIVIVFDAWSAHDVGLLGYPRQTMPNLERFAANAIVYHNHYSAGTFTVPGTASLLTGLYPWSHRALQLGGGIIRPHIKHEVFTAVQGALSTVGYTQNTYADVIMGQAEKYINNHIRTGSFNLEDDFLYNLPVFKNDTLISYAAIEDNIFNLGGKGTTGSLFAAPISNYLLSRQKLLLNEKWAKEYPDGLPDSDSNGVYTLEGVVEGVIQALSEIKEPTFAYLHFLPPHEPYDPTAEFIKAFDDNLHLVDKPVHPLAYKSVDWSGLQRRRRLYDQYLASWDQAVHKLFDFLQTSGLRDNSYIFVTADHGELFERGETGHFTPLIYDPLVHIPLIVSKPGQTGRRDISTPTSNVDILPTVARLTNITPPDWVEGALLPGLGGIEDTNRSIFVMDAKEDSSYGPLTKFSASISRNGYRLTHYHYSTYEGFELYNLVDDPEELENLYDASPSIAHSLQDELAQKIADVNRPYEKK
ncbi:MAG: sulfatase-like hydrolase/transferase [Chloroflexi bacterium]|nr:sulfatase-like hydrolase/transferase [Chloroflexota bacterium]